jgi:hypothetical protein
MVKCRWVVLAALVGVSLAPAEVRRDLASARMQADLQFLTSDECEGRGPGTTGIDKAADYIAASFKDSGLKPGAAEGSYFQHFSIRGPATPGKASIAVTGPDGFRLVFSEKDLATLGLSGSGEVKADLVFAGYSVVAEKVPYDDFAGLDVEGKVVVMLRRCPRYSGEPKFGDDDTARAASALATKIANAEKRKAAAVLLVNDRTQVKESGDALAQFSTFAFGSPAKIPALHIRRDLADVIIRRATGKSLDEIETEINANLKPQSAVLKDWKAEVIASVDRDRKIAVKNVVGVLDGAGPLADETIIVGAHYDHLGYGGRGSLDRNARNKIHYGADDNASGTTTILELARRFAAMKDRVGRRIVFIAFSAEELGLLGSAHYCKEPLFPLDKTAAMVNLDMVGRLVADKESGQDKIEIGGTGTAKQFDALVDKHNEKPKFKVKKSPSGMGPSDHQSFYLKNLPVLFLFTGLHPDYHKPTDTWDKINLTGMMKITDMTEDIVADLASGPRPEFTKSTAPAMRPSRQGEEKAGPADGPVMPRIRLGIGPGYDESGDGMEVQMVVEGGLAEKAGIKSGDRIVELAGQPIKNVTAYMAALGTVKAGAEFEVVVLRGKDRKTFKIVAPAENRPARTREKE